MKKKVFFLAAVLIIATFAVNAQGNGQGFQRRSVEERVKAVMEKFEVFQLDATKKAEVDSIFSRSYRAQDAKREEMRNSGNMDREAMRAEMQKFGADRDDKLKKVLTDDQFKKWKDEIEPSLRPQRPNGGGGNN